MNVNSLRFRLIWFHSIAIVLIVVCIGLTRYQLASYRSHHRFDATLAKDAQFFVSRFGFRDGGFRLSTAGLSIANALAIQELEHFFVITDPEGKVLLEEFHSRFVRKMLYEGGMKEILRQRSGFGKVTAEDGSVYRFISLAIPPGIFAQPAILHLGRSMELQRGVMREYLLFYFYSVPLILAVSISIGWYFSGRALRPFEEIARIAEKINYENLNMQIDSAHSEQEVRRLVQSFNGMVARLDNSFNQMRKFNADVAHELRTPLSIIQGETEIALRSQDLPEELRSVLISNLEELDLLTRIVNDLLTLSEAEAGRQVLVREPVHVGDLLEDLVDQMRLLISDRNLVVRVQSDPDLWIRADKLWIRRAVLNLLDNAIKYSKEEGRIEVSAVRDGNRIVIGVSDTGIGIRADALPFIFDRLYRADPARGRNSGGLGLGLTLVKWIVEAHRGVVRVDSRLGEGSLFEIVLPLDRRPPSQCAPEPRPFGD